VNCFITEDLYLTGEFDFFFQLLVFCNKAIHNNNLKQNLKKSSPSLERKNALKLSIVSLNSEKK
jgi:hypothetical protein